MLLLALVCFGAARPEAARSEPTFSKAERTYRLEFPRDHGSHPAFQTEWWYYTGHLYSLNQQPFKDPSLYGFQLTFFRRSDVTAGSKEWDQTFLSQAALSDFGLMRFLFSSRLARGGLGLAGATRGFLRVWNRDWKAEMLGSKHALEFSLESGGETKQVRLLAVPQSEPVLHAEAGFSTKSRDGRYASHYYSSGRLALEGQITSGDSFEAVHGLAWMDHEFMSSALAPGLHGWDWFSLILEDGRQLMLFKLRHADRSSDYAAGTLIQDGLGRHLNGSDFVIEERATWQSPHSNAVYPSLWRIRVPAQGLDIEVKPRLADQELHQQDKGSPTYWEGAVQSDDLKTIGYAELTGYAQPLGGKL